jgi:hypothetical protein
LAASKSTTAAVVDANKNLIQDAKSDEGDKVVKIDPKLEHQ